MEQDDNETMFVIRDAVMVEIDEDGVGYATFDGKRWHAGKHDFDTNPTEALREILTAAQKPAARPTQEPAPVVTGWMSGEDFIGSYYGDD